MRQRRRCRNAWSPQPPPWNPNWRVPGSGSPKRSAFGESPRRPEEATMLESAEIGHKIDKKVYTREEVRLGEALLNGQFELTDKARGPVVVIIRSVERGGR